LTQGPAEGLSKPLNLLINDRGACRKSALIQSHFSKGPFPYGCFVKIENGLLTSSPELCFVHMANRLSLIDLIQLGYELCGGYTLPAEPSARGQAYRETTGGFVNCPPLTNVAAIENLLKKLSGVHGQKRAVRASSYILDNAASPLEAKLTLLLTLPYRLGGYGLPKPRLNFPIDDGQVQRRCDLYWPEAKLAVEYDSDQFHVGAERINLDSMRRSALELKGISVVTITRQQIYKMYRLHEVASLLAKRLERRLSPRDPNFTSRQLKLRAHLLSGAPPQIFCES
jgi:hypothetical protein